MVNIEIEKDDLEYLIKDLEGRVRWAKTTSPSRMQDYIYRTSKIIEALKKGSDNE